MGYRLKILFLYVALEESPSIERCFIWLKTGNNLYYRDYLDLGSKSPYSVRVRENTDQKKLRIWALFRQWFRQGKARALGARNYYHYNIYKNDFKNQ